MRKIKDPSKKNTKKKLALHPFELVWYILCGLVGIWGITYIVLGLVAQNLPIKSEDGDFVQANAKFAKTFGLDFFGWGLIILAIAAVAAVIVLLLFSNRVDRDYEKTVRRAQRMAQLEAEEEKLEAEEANVVDAEVEPVKEQPQPEEPEELKEEPQAQPEEIPAEEPAPEEATVEEPLQEESEPEETSVEEPEEKTE